MINYSRQKISQKDKKNVLDVLSSDYLTQGPKVNELEDNISKFCNVNYTVSVNSATSALHLACLSLGLTRNDILWTSPISFVASSNCALYCNASVDFVDISLNDFNIDLEVLEKKLILASKKKSLPKAIVVVHHSGRPINLKKLYRLKKLYKFKIIEDASHALGSYFYNSPIGSCKYSDIAVFSLHAIKPITSAEGGLICTNKKSLFNKLIMLRSHGITKNKKNFIFKDKYPSYYYEQLLLGYNYRLSDIQCALGTSQLSQIDNFNKKKTILFDRYKNKLSLLPLILPIADNKHSFSAKHLFVIRLKDGPEIRDRLFEFLRERKIYCNVHYIPIYRQPYYKKMRLWNKKNFVNSEIFFSTAISIPLYAGLTIKEQSTIIFAIKEFFKKK